MQPVTPTGKRAMNIYSVIVNAEDGNYREFEIEAPSESAAIILADAIAQDCMVDVTFVEVYRIA